MLTIQPNLTSGRSNTLNFGNGLYNSGMFDDAEYVDFEEVIDTPQGRFTKSKNFDIDLERQKAADELDLWQETKQNLNTIARTTESVPVLNKGMKIASGLISIAVGWGGLRWGTVGTLKVLSDLNKSTGIRYIKNLSKDFGSSISKVYNNSKNYIAKTDWAKNIEKEFGTYKKSFAESSVGTTLTGWKTAIQKSSLYKKTTDAKDVVVNYCKTLNPKRIFFFFLGVAGGGTAAVNTIGGKTIDGNRHDIRQIDDDVYVIDNRWGVDYRNRGGYRNAS